MSDTIGTLERIAAEVGRAFSPLLGPLAATNAPTAVRALVADLGFSLPEPLPPSLLALKTHIASLAAALASLEAVLPDAGQTSNVTEQLTRAALVIEALARASRTMALLPDQLQAELPAAFASASQIRDHFLPRLFGSLVVDAVSERATTAAQILRLVGIFDISEEVADAARFQPAFHRRQVRWDRIPLLLSDPPAVFAEVYGWGTNRIRTEPLLDVLLSVAQALEAPSRFDYPSVDLIRAVAPGAEHDRSRYAQMLEFSLLELYGAQLTIAVTSIPTLSIGEQQGLAIRLQARGNAFGASAPLLEGVTLTLEGSESATAGLAVVFRPGHPPAVITDLPGAAIEVSTGALTVRLDHHRASYEGPLRPVEIPGVLDVEIGGAYLLSRLAVGGGAADVSIEAGIQRSQAVFNAAKADGFLAGLLPANGLVIPFEAGLGWSTTRGVYFQGSAGLETILNLHLSLGPILLNCLHIRLRAESEGLELELAIDGTAAVGPIQVAIERVGAIGELTFDGGNLGPVDLSIDFKPPNGLGLVIDAGPITGGGFIAFKRELGRYAGVLELEMFGIGVTAIGLLETKDGSGQPLPPPGFSFLLIISAQFEALQIGFGFTLNKVGGLVGIHRSMALERLRSAVRDGSLDRVMFPEDPVRNMPQIISDLTAFYPPTTDRFVFGPMAEIGWGTPTLFEAEIGVIIEVPAPIYIALLGQLNVALPTKDADIVALHVSIFGLLDFGKKLLSIDASLYDSRVALFTVEGDMALRVSWGDPPSFALSFGGLNKHFQPPPQFPTLRPITVALGLNDNPRVGVQGYLAVTSNSIQFGANAELYAAAGPLNVLAWVKFDALVVFSPFFFIFEFSLGASLRWDEAIIAGVRICGVLSGPTPFHIRGEACLTILFFDLCVSFDVSVGERRQVELPKKDPWPLLEEAIKESKNWSATLAPGVRTCISFKEPANPSLMLVHPMGSVTMRQKILPLNSDLDKFGEFQIIGATRFDVVDIRVGAESVLEPGETPEWVEDYFAPGQFQELTSARKLSAPSFDKMVAGVVIASTDIAFGEAASARTVPLQYKTTIIDEPMLNNPLAPSREIRIEPAFSQATQVAMSARSAKTYSPLRRAGSTKFAGMEPKKPFLFADEDYAIAGTADIGIRREFGSGLSKTIAHQILATHIAAHPEDRGYLQVIPTADLEIHA